MRRISYAEDLRPAVVVRLSEPWGTVAVALFGAFSSFLVLWGIAHFLFGIRFGDPLWNWIVLAPPLAALMLVGLLKLYERAGRPQILPVEPEGGTILALGVVWLGVQALERQTRPDLLPVLLFAGIVTDVARKLLWRR